MLVQGCAVTSEPDKEAYNNSKYNSLDFNNKSDIRSGFTKSGTITLSYPITRTLVGNREIYSLSGSLNSENKIPYSELNHDDKLEDLDSNHNLIIKDSPSETRFAPLIGFVPVHASFQPADNEIWMELERETSTIRVFKGKEKLKEIKGQGKITLAPGEYPLQHKQKAPLWYATDEYFEKRQLRVPPRGDHFRYRRGALGTYALYPTMDFIIHSGPFFSEEIGGFKVNNTELSEIFTILNIGSPIIVK